MDSAGPLLYVCAIRVCDALFAVRRELLNERAISVTAGIFAGRCNRGPAIVVPGNRRIRNSRTMQAPCRKFALDARRRMITVFEAAEENMEAPRVWFRNSPNAGAFHLPGAIGKALCGHDLSRPSCALDTPSIVHFKDQRICKVCRAMSEGHWAKRS